MPISDESKFSFPIFYQEIMLNWRKIQIFIEIMIDGAWSGIASFDYTTNGLFFNIAKI